MNLLELFAGAGGAAIGLKAAGYDGLHYEWDVDAHATLTAAGFHGYRIDVRKARWQGWGNYYGHPHLLWASPPCQAFSQAGNRLGAKDERNGWPWTLDAIDGARPTWVVCGIVRWATPCRPPWRRPSPAASPRSDPCPRTTTCSCPRCAT